MFLVPLPLVLPPSWKPLLGRLAGHDGDLVRRLAGVLRLEHEVAVAGVPVEEGEERERKEIEERAERGKR